MRTPRTTHGSLDAFSRHPEHFLPRPAQAFILDYERVRNSGNTGNLG